MSGNEQAVTYFGGKVLEFISSSFSQLKEKALSFVNPGKLLDTVVGFMTGHLGDAIFNSDSKIILMLGSAVGFMFGSLPSNFEELKELAKKVGASDETIKKIEEKAVEVTNKAKPFLEEATANAEKLKNEATNTVIKKIEQETGVNLTNTGTKGGQHVDNGTNVEPPNTPADTKAKTDEKAITQ